MTVTPLPTAERRPIDDPGEIAGIETALSALAGLLAARGGFVALGGRDLFAMSVEGRAVLLTEMYGSGEVILGWREPGGPVINLALERLRVRVGGATRIGWRAQFYREDAEEGGHLLLGALMAASVPALSDRLLSAAADLAAAPLAAAGAALAAFAGN